MVQPPSSILKDFFMSIQGSLPTDEMLTSIARNTLLPISEVRLWLEHLQTVDSNRKETGLPTGSIMKYNFFKPFSFFCHLQQYAGRTYTCAGAG